MEMMFNRFMDWLAGNPVLALIALSAIVILVCALAEIKSRPE